MKLFFFIALIGLSVLFPDARTFNLPGQLNHSQKGADSGTSTISCAPPVADPVKAPNDRYIPALEGWGHHVFTISTKQDSAQFFFNQGMSFYYGYHLHDAQASFLEAARFDSSSAMVYWGQALSMGPYYNNPVYKMRPGVPEVLAAMERHSAGSTGKEQLLIAAMRQRYSSDLTNADRSQLDKAYADALSGLVQKYPDDDEINALYIDAVMLEHKWDFWGTNGTAKPWTPELVALCEGILKRNPRHPAALHYYIHLTEASDKPELALPYAEILKDQMPGVGHMVHMATHSYQRNGLYVKGVLYNEIANTAYNREDSLAPMLGTGQNNIIHIYAVQSLCAMTAGMYEKGKPLYERARERCIAGKPHFTSDAYSQFVTMLPFIADVRLGKWDEIMQAAAPDPGWKYAGVLYHFARGMANTRLNRLSAARADLDSIRGNLDDNLLQTRLLPFDKPAQCGSIAAGILQGEILIKEGGQDKAIAVLRQAVNEEDSLIYREPMQWYLPARQYLGAALLKAGKAVEADRVYRQDLVRNPGNGWALLGLYQSLVAQHRSEEAALIRTKYQKAFEASDVNPVASVF